MEIVFGNEWFNKYQSRLLWFLNTPIVRVLFRHVMRIEHKGIIHRITPNAFWYDGKRIGDKTEVTVDFRTHAKYAKRLFYAFKPFWYLIHFWDLITVWEPRLNLGFDTLTVYPDAGDPGTTSCDGMIDRAAVDETFSTIRAGAGTVVNMTAVTIRALLTASGTTNQYTTLRRSWTLFDTSPLGSGAAISSAVLSLWGTTKQNDLGSPDLYIGGGTTASNVVLATGDFVNRGTTSFGSVSYAGFDATNSVYTDITLNASGIANIQDTGISVFTEQLSWDILNSTTGLTWATSGVSSQFLFRASDQTGTANDPKLVITYTPGSTSNSNFLFFMPN